eukprot:TRINITY_DN3855_c0_g1_i1.p1 TRINITY_DN3855_c0_g1~~TRINITY_DN3855_c0_g1_i1.p1  ORF type:complete len:417 (+),score=58.65 TRINITY_DN3855_c0_g1_i1:62-1312(+)
MSTQEHGGVHGKKFEIGADNLKVEGPGLYKGRIRETNTFIVTTNASPQIRVIDPSGKNVELQIMEIGDQRLVDYIPESGGVHVIKIRVGELERSFSAEIEGESLVERKSVGVEVSSALLYSAAYNGDEGAVSLQLSGGGEMDAQNEKGWTPLHAAADQGHLGVVQILVDSNCQIDVLNENGTTPLSVAASHGHLAIVEYLVQCGADLQLARKGGWTPLHTACFHEYPQVVSYLLQNGASPSTPCAALRGYTPLHIVLSSGESTPMDIVEMLISCGAPLDAQSDTGSTPLHLAAFYNRYEASKLLVVSGASLTIKNGRGHTPSQEAAFFGHTDLAMYLAEVQGSEVHSFEELQLEPGRLSPSVQERPPSPQIWTDKKLKLREEEGQGKKKLSFAPTPEIVRWRRETRQGLATPINWG